MKIMQLSFVFAISVFLSSCNGCKKEKLPESTSENVREQGATMDKEAKKLIAKVKTSLGEFSVELFYDKVPSTVANFTTLAKEGFYNGTIFHRVIDGFMIQGGDPEGSGRGGPSYRFADEFVSSLKHSKKGILSMANAGPNTNGSQFFITLVPTPHLDGRHTVFGDVVAGMDVVDKIGKVATDSQDRPLTKVAVDRIEIDGDWYTPPVFEKITAK